MDHIQSAKDHIDQVISDLDTIRKDPATGPTTRVALDKVHGFACCVWSSILDLERERAATAAAVPQEVAK